MIIRWATFLPAFAVAALANLAYWTYEGRLQPVTNAGVDTIESVSFSPYRRGETPLIRVSPTQDEISADIAVLAGRVAGIRTYTSLEGLEEVPRYARPLGIKVIQGAWLGRDPAVNEREVRSAIRLANLYPDVIADVVVGNEVLLRRDLTLKQLAAYIRRVKTAIKQPVTYADVWEFWLRNPELASSVDFITIHILPYWEDNPIPIDHAIDHVMSIYKKVQAAFPGKRIAIGEIGWPSTGRMRGGARPSIVNEARFVRGFIRRATAEKIDYNIVEAFDQSWKRALEGTVGGHWGLLDSDRHAKFELSGPVSDDPNWRWHFVLSTGFAALAVLFAWWRRPQLDLRKAFLYAAGAQVLGAFLVLDGALTATTCWTPFGWLSGGLGLAASVVLAILLLKALGDRLSGLKWPVTPLPTAEEALNLLRRRPVPGPSFGERMLGLLQFGFVVGAVVTTVALIIDPRYRDFPSAAFLVPAFGYGALAVSCDRRAPSSATLREEALLVTMLILGSVGVIVGEAFQNLGEARLGNLSNAIAMALENTQALGWSATLLLLALPWGVKLATRHRAAAAKAAP